MITVAKSVRVASSVLAMNGNEKILIIIDSSYNMYLLNKATFEIIKKIPITSKYGTRHPYDHSFSISSNLDILISSPSDARAFLMRFTEKLQAVKTMDYNDRVVSCSCFSSDSHIVTIGGQDGKTFLYDVDKKQLTGALKTVPDHISAIAYSADKRFVAISSFDKSTVIFNLECNVVVRRFKLEDFAIEEAIFVDGDTKIIGLTRHKSLVMYDIPTRALTTSVFEVSDWPTQVVAMGPHHIVVATKGYDLYLINHYTFKITKVLTLENSGITHMLLQNHYLYLGYVDGQVDIINTHLYIKELTLHLRINEFKESTALIEKNPFLLTQEMVSKYDKLWPMTLEKVKQLLFEGKVDEALDMAKPFFLDPRKEEEYNFCLGHADIFEKLQEYIDKKSYLEAHSLCDDYPYLKNARVYELLDKQWTRLFQACKLLFIKNDPASHASAKATLRPYMAVPSKKVLIENLESEYKTYMKADELIRERNFKGYFDLVGYSPFLKYEEMYTRVLQIGNQTLEKLKILEGQGRYDDALKVAMYLKDFTPLREKITQTMEMLTIKKQMIVWIENNQILKIYECVDKYKDLEFFDPFIAFHKHFLDLQEKGWELAKLGRSAWIAKTFAPYVRAAYTMHTVGQIIKKSYLQEFKFACDTQRSEIDFERTIKQYMGLFGLDNELFYLARTEKFENMLKLDDKSGNERGYETKEYPHSILVHNA
jgi:hypothetical protein